MHRYTTLRYFLVASISGFYAMSSFGGLYNPGTPGGYPAAKHFNVEIDNKPKSLSIPLLNSLEWTHNSYSIIESHHSGKSLFLPIPFIRSTSDPTRYFRSRNSGAWVDINTWESSTDKLNWINATLVPTSAAQEILIYNDHTVSLGGDVSAKSLTIAAEGTLTNPGADGGFTLTIEKDPEMTEAEFKIYGTYLIFGKQPAFNSGSTAVVYGNALVRAEDNIGGGSAGFANNLNVYFKDKAIFEWNNTKPFATSGITYFPNAGETEIPVFKVSENPGDVGTGLLIINGILEVNTDFTFAGGSNKVFRNGITGNSTLTQHNISNNRFTIGGTEAILGGSSLILNLSSPLYLVGFVTVPEQSNITIQGANINNIKTGNVFSIQGDLDMTNNQITNTGGSVLISGLYRTSATGSITHELASIPSGIVTTLPGSTIEFYKKGEQFFKSRADFSNIIFSGSGTKKASSGFAPSGTLTIKEEAILDSRGQNIGNENTRLVMTDDSRLILSTSGRNPAMDGGYDLAGGVIQFDNSALTKQTIRGTFGPEPGIPFHYNQIEVTGISVGNGSGNINLREGGKFTVKSGAVFEINANAIKAATGSSNQQVIVESGAIFKTGNEHGFHGIEIGVFPIVTSSVHPNITQIVLQPNSTVDYHRSSKIQTSGLQTITTTLPYHHLVISGNEEKKVSENGLLTIKGNLHKKSDAVFKHNNSTVIFIGTSSQDYISAVPQMEFNHIINRNSSGLNIMDSLSVFRTFTLEDQSILNIHADITLKSRAESTAEMAFIPNNAIINYVGNPGIITERFISGPRKAWQFLSAPVFGDQTIHQAWQEESAPGMSLLNNAPGAAGNKNPGYGTTFTSDRPSWSADGFDRHTAPGPSIKIFNSAENRWEGLTGTHIPLQSENGYMIMVRGDRSVITHDAPSTGTIMRSRGRIYDTRNLPPDIVIPNTPGLFISVGNPYPSAINFNNTVRTNLSESYIIWDPKLTNGPSSSYGLGAYRTVSGEVAVPSGNNYVEGNIPPIQSGQAFFVQLAEGALSSGLLSFSEEAKTSGSRAIFRNGVPLPPEKSHLRINLYVAGKDKPFLLDGIITQFEAAYSAELDKWDAIKMFNPEENIGILSNAKTLAIERRPLCQQTDTLFYSLSGLRKQTYQLEFISKKMDVTGLDTFVEDTHLKQETYLNPSDTTRLNFEVNNDPGSQNKNRFRIIFKPLKNPLPVTLQHFSAKIKNTDINLQWTSEDESNIEKFELEKSTNGIDFKLLAEMTAKKENKNKYQASDVSPPAGIHYYRLKIIFKNGDLFHSKTVKVVVQGRKVDLGIYPNPIENGIINLQIKTPVNVSFDYRISNSTGQIILTRKLHIPPETIVKKLNINSQPQGLYLLEILFPDGEKKTLKVWKGH